MLALVAPLALAGANITDVSAPIAVDASASWPHPFARADGNWDFVTASQSSVTNAVFDASWKKVGGSSEIVADSSLIDHSFARCPDGTFLHVGMGTRASEKHSATVRHFDQDWKLLNTKLAIDNDESAIVVDQPLVCGETFAGFAFTHFYSELDPETRYLPITADGDTQPDVAMESFFSPGGISLIDHKEHLYAVASDAGVSEFLRIVTIDSDFHITDDHLIQMVEPQSIAYWPQGAVNVAGDFFVVFITQTRADDWVDPYGNVVLAHFDEDWNLLETVPIFSEGPAMGAFQPTLEYSNGILVAAFRLQTYVNNVVEISLEEFEPEPDPEDTGVDSAGPEDSADSGRVADDSGPSDTSQAAAADTSSKAAKSGGCGCASGGVSGIWLGLFGASALRRRATRSTV